MTYASDSAFPGPNDKCCRNGLTKREYFAILALQGILAEGKIRADVADNLIAYTACSLADALITELSK